MMAGYGPVTGTSERCRYCVFDLTDSVSVMNHYNSHWRQCTQENVTDFNPCAFEPHPDTRIGSTSINSEDLEVSGHLAHHNSFNYSYSPQTEPSNLSLTGTRCSPLNLTGKSKLDSPLTSPLASPLPADTQSNASPHSYGIQQNHLQSVDMQSDLNISHQYSHFNNINNGLFTMQNQMISSLPMNDSIDGSCQGEVPELSGCDVAKRRRKFEREIRCQTCNRSFFTKSSYDEHFHLYHSKSLLENSNHNFLMNNEPVDSSLSYQDHSNHSIIPSQFNSSKPYKCSICDQEFLYKEELIEHSNNHEASKPYRCEICGTGLSHISALRRHVLSHSGHKPHTCEVCNRGFFQKCDLVRHYSTHGKKRDIECSQCKRKFFSEYYFKNHKCKLPEDDKPFKCDICGNSCSTNIAWSYHMWKHTKNPIFVPFQSKRGTSQILSTNVAEKNTLLQN